MSRITNWASDTQRPLIGGWALLGPSTAAALALSEADWVGVDAQHGSFDAAAVEQALRLIEPGRDVLVRVPVSSPEWIGRALDAGARGVIVPMVETGADAEEAVRLSRYPGVGDRSWGPFVGRWGRPVTGPEEANASIVCAVMVENRRGLENVDAIASTTGVDMIFVGPFDLSLALGTDVDDLLEQGVDGPLGVIVEACRKYDVIPGAFAGNRARVAALSAIGFRVLAGGEDIELLKAAASAMVTSR